MFIIAVPFARLAERDVTRTTFKCCRKFCSFASKQIVTAHVASPWCTDLQQRMLLDRFLCDVQQASRFSYTAQLVSCESSCSYHLKLKMWQQWIWKVFHCKIPICKTGSQDPSKLPPPWIFLYARHSQVHIFLIRNGCAHLLQQYALGTVLQLEGAALTHGASFSLGGLGLPLSMLI